MSFEFVSASESHELVALCANSVVIEDRIDQLLREIKSTDTTDWLQTICRQKSKQQIYVSFEIFVRNDGNKSSNDRFGDAIFTLCRRYSHVTLIELLQSFVLLGVEILHKTSGTQSVSFLCQYHDDLIDLMKTLTDYGYISAQVGNPIVNLCQRNRTKNLITRARSLLNHGIESIRLDCDSVANSYIVVQDLEQMFSNFDDVVGESPINLNSTKDQCALKNILESCRTTIHINIHSPLYERMIYNHQMDHEEESGIFSFNTRENTVYLPAFKEWENIRMAWHYPEMNPNPRQLGQRIAHYLDQYSHQIEECEKSLDTCEWCRVGSDVDDYLSRLMEKVEEMYSLFAVERLIHYGSSAEKTNIFRASEFDRGVVLKYFGQLPSDPDQIVYTGNDPAYVILKEDEKPINSSSLLILFMKAITDALQRVHSVHVFAPTVAFGETCVTIFFLYSGRHPSAAVKVSVDITMAVKALQQPPLVSSGWFMSDEEEGIILLVPHRKGVGNQWRLSYPTLEKEMLLHAGSSVARVYQLLKFLAALHHAKDNSNCEIPRKSSLSSYALKTCMFRYMRYKYQPPPWQPEDTLRHAIGVLRQFPQNSCEMTSFFNKEIVVLNVTQSSKKAVTEILSMLNKMTIF